MAARKKYGVKYPALYADKDHPHAAVGASAAVGRALRTCGQRLAASS